jgi:hypothetical protein
MSDSQVKTSATSWATPAEGDNRRWDGMTRAQQLAALQALAQDADTTTTTDLSVSEIVERARAAKARRTRHDPTV